MSAQVKAASVCGSGDLVGRVLVSNDEEVLEGRRWELQPSFVLQYSVPHRTTWLSRKQRASVKIPSRGLGRWLSG